MTIAQQVFNLQSLFPLGNCQAHKNHLVWVGELQPTPLSAVYKIKINYELNSAPKTYVVRPQLTSRPGERLPHVYSHEEQKLCLYYPLGDRPDWNASKSLAETIVPWASEWLFYYEIWLATGEWLGGGIHLPPNKKNSQKSKRKSKR